MGTRNSVADAIPRPNSLQSSQVVMQDISSQLAMTFVHRGPPSSPELLQTTGFYGPSLVPGITTDHRVLQALPRPRVLQTTGFYRPSLVPRFYRPPSQALPRPQVLQALPRPQVLQALPMFSKVLQNYYRPKRVPQFPQCFLYTDTAYRRGPRHGGWGGGGMGRGLGLGRAGVEYLVPGRRRRTATKSSWRTEIAECFGGRKGLDGISARPVGGRLQSQQQLME